MAKGKREERKKLCPLSSPVPAPLAQSSCMCQGWRVPGRQAVMLEGSAARKAMSAPGLGTRLQTGWKGPRPPPHCLVPGQLPLAAHIPEQEPGPLCSLPSWGRLCWARLPALSSILAVPCSLPVRPPLPMCWGNRTLASIRVRSLAPALPSPAGPLTYWSAAAWARTARGALVESCSPGEPCSPPRPPWGGWGVSLSSCRTEERGKGGQGGSFGETPQHRGAAGCSEERRGLCSGAPCQLHTPALSRSRPARHCGAGAMAALTICSAMGCHRGRSQRAPL